MFRQPSAARNKANSSNPKLAPQWMAVYVKGDLIVAAAHLEDCLASVEKVCANLYGFCLEAPHWSQSGQKSVGNLARQRTPHKIRRFRLESIINYTFVSRRGY